MIQIKEKQNCCGCTACANVCPKNCIEMVMDNEGFIYPVIDLNSCINCNACERACPMTRAIVLGRGESRNLCGKRPKAKHSIYGNIW